MRKMVRAAQHRECLGDLSHCTQGSIVERYLQIQYKYYGTSPA